MTVTAVHLGGRPDQPLLVLGPSLGTSATTLWSAAAEHLAQDFHVIAWELPGHGANRSVPECRLSMAALARDVLELVDEARGESGESFHYAGDSVGGCVGLQLLLDAPERVTSAVLLCTGACIGTPEAWQERAEAVQVGGTSSMVAGSRQRWFAPGFLERSPERGSALLQALADVDDVGYVAACDALADFDVRSRLGEIGVPVLVVAGEDDVATPPEVGGVIADGVPGARLEVLPDVGHLAPDRGTRDGGSTGSRARPPGGRPRAHEEAGASGRLGRATRGARRRPRRPRDRRGHRPDSGLSGDDHRVRVGQHLDPSGPGPPLAFDDHAYRPHRAWPP